MTKTPLRDYTIVLALLGTPNTTPGISPFNQKGHPLVLNFSHEALEDERNHQSLNGVPRPIADIYVNHFPVVGNEEAVTQRAIKDVLAVIAGTIAGDTGESSEEVFTRIKGYIK